MLLNAAVLNPTYRNASLANQGKLYPPVPVPANPIYSSW